MLASRSRTRSPTWSYIVLSRECRWSRAHPGAGGVEQAGLLQPHLAVPLRRGLGQLAEHDQPGQRRQRAGAPGIRPGGERLGQLRREPEGEALVAADMVVGADELVAGAAEQGGAGHQLAAPPARGVAEAAAADEG